MSKPEDIPEDVWRAAEVAHGQFADSSVTMNLGEIIARAILAERERCAELIEASMIVDTEDGERLRNRSEGNRIGLAYATAIRAGGH